MRAPTYIQSFPGPAGIATATGITQFQDLKQPQEANDHNSIYLFANLHEWELAETLMTSTSGMSLQNINKISKLPIVSLTPSTLDTLLRDVFSCASIHTPHTLTNAHFWRRSMCCLLLDPPLNAPV
ncbi:hypothetical protein K439DRAFT_417682 [Ramaria rubella]|nr:hypothetical protein K439DRAFT_417682 [Ramaria rubella]